MSENINSEALDRLLELDGQFYDKPDLVRMARIRADVLHASAAWGSSEDGALVNALADRVEQVREALQWALAELNGKTRYDNDAQRENCFALAEAALASVLSGQGASKLSDRSAQETRMTEAETERAAVVAWLRSRALHLLSVGYDNEAYNFEAAADDIEAGEHLTNEGK